MCPIKQLSGELEAEHKNKLEDLEEKINVKLKERQEIFNQVFQQDMRQYIISGIIPVMKNSGEFNLLGLIRCLKCFNIVPV